MEWDSLVLPIKAGDRVGKVRILSKEGRALSATDLFAVRDVDPTFAYRIGMILVWVKRELSPFVPFILALIGAAVLFGGFSFSCRVKRRT